MCFINVNILQHGLMSHRKLYVCIAVGLCLLMCSLILFFLFPRSMDMSDVELQSSMVYFTPDTVKIVVTVGDLTYIDDTLRFNCCNAFFFYKACNPMCVLSVLQHKMNLTNQNFVSITADNLSVQALIFETVVGNTKLLNVTNLPPRSQKTVKLFLFKQIII